MLDSNISSHFISSDCFSGVDILKLVAAQVGTQWIDVYQSLANATEREVAAFSNGYSSDHERAYAALQHWTIRDGDANLAKLINALHRQRRIDVVEKIRCVMEDNPQVHRIQMLLFTQIWNNLHLRLLGIRIIIRINWLFFLSGILFNYTSFTWTLIPKLSGINHRLVDMTQFYLDSFFVFLIVCVHVSQLGVLTKSALIITFYLSTL